jgi:hypothetical protein
MILWDLNVWFEDLGQDDNGNNQWSEIISINPAIYHRDNDTIYSPIRKVHTGIIYKCSPNETTKIRAFRRESEYGTDWWDFADEFSELEISKSINDFIASLGDASTIDISKVDDLYHIDSIDKLSGLRLLPANGQGS